MKTENDVWSRQIVVDFSDGNGGTASHEVTLFSRWPSGYDYVYEGQNVKLAAWLNGLWESNALHMLLDNDDEDIDDNDDETPLCVKCGPIPDREGGWCPEDPEEGYCAGCCPIHKDL